MDLAVAKVGARTEVLFFDHFGNFWQKPYKRDRMKPWGTLREGRASYFRPLRRCWSWRGSGSGRSWGMTTPGAPFTISTFKR